MSFRFEKQNALLTLYRAYDENKKDRVRELLEEIEKYIRLSCEVPMGMVPLTNDLIEHAQDIAEQCGNDRKKMPEWVITVLEERGTYEEERRRMKEHERHAKKRLHEYLNMD